MDLVDDDDNVIGVAPRDEIRIKNLLHRGTAILVRNTKGEIFVHKRTMSKKIYPGLWDIFVGGAVDSGESYEESAIRELEEELGISEAKLSFLFRHRFISDINDNFIGVFSLTHDGPVKIQEEEIDKGWFMPLHELEALMKKEEFCPDAIEIFDMCREFL